MIYKVYYQENALKYQFAKTQKAYMLRLTQNEKFVHYLKDRNYNIEFVQLLEGNILNMNKKAQISNWRRA